MINDNPVLSAFVAFLIVLVIGAVIVHVFARRTTKARNNNRNAAAASPGTFVARCAGIVFFLLSFMH
jgi:hypothetical protein